MGKTHLLPFHQHTSVVNKKTHYPSTLKNIARANVSSEVKRKARTQAHSDKGADKVSINTAAVLDRNLIRKGNIGAELIAMFLLHYLESISGFVHHHCHHSVL